MSTLLENGSSDRDETLQEIRTYMSSSFKMWMIFSDLQIQMGFTALTKYLPKA